MLAVMKRELRSYFSGPMAYVFSAFMLGVVGYFTSQNLEARNPNFDHVLANSAVIFVGIIPILTMRVLAEERHTKTDQLLYSLPITVGQFVMGKYLAMVVVIAFPCLIMALYPLQLSMFGDIPFASAFSMLFAFFLLGTCLASIGMFISSLTESQVSAAVICLVAMILSYFMRNLTSMVPSSAYASLLSLCVLMLLFGLIVYVFTRNAPFSLIVAIVGVAAIMGLYVYDSTMFSGLFPTLILKISPFDRLYAFASNPYVGQGSIFDLTAVVYFLSVSAMFLFFTVQTLERRRWS